MKWKIPHNKLIAFGSDGASVMSGSDKGVKGRLLELNPHLIHIHCMAHRLALSTSRAADMKNYQEWLTSVFYYFKASPTREEELHEVQTVLDLPVLKCKEIHVHAIRWLSCYEAVSSVFRCLDALISYFHKREASKDPKAKGLLKKMATTSFIYITYLLMDVLPIVSRLCLALQKENLDVAVAKVREQPFDFDGKRLERLFCFKIFIFCVFRIKSFIFYIGQIKLFIFIFEVFSSLDWSKSEGKNIFFFIFEIKFYIFN